MTVRIPVTPTSSRVHPARELAAATLVLPAGPDLQAHTTPTTRHLRAVVATTVSTIAKAAALPLRTLGKILRNALLGVAIAWLQALLLSYGNVFSGARPVEQSRASFLVASMMWQHVFFCVVVLSIHVVLLRQERLLDAPETPPPYTTCLGLLAPTAGVVFLATSLGVIAVGTGIAQLSSGIFAGMHANLYALPMCSFLFVVSAHWKTRLIVRTKTVRGRVRRELQAQQQGQLQHHSTSSKQRGRRPVMLDVLCRDLPFLLSVAVATGYVHLVESLRMETTWHLLAFAGTSVAVKAAIQEFAKYHLLRIKRTSPLRVMAVIVATPTILIDTQLRMVLMCESANRFSAVGSVLLAVVEIALRVAKSLLMRRQASRTDSMLPMKRRPSLQRKSSVRRPRLTWDGRHNIRDIVRNTSTSTTVTGLSAKLGALHTDEVIADMYAEYMAMGCSYGALLLLRSHPRFQMCSFRGASEAAALEASTALASWSLLGTVALQLGLEAAVDFAACTLEVRFGGANFAHFNQDDAFFVVFLVAIAAVNMGVTCGVTLVE